MKPAKAGQPYSAAINHVIVGQVLLSPALNEGHVLVNPPYLELLSLNRAGVVWRGCLQHLPVASILPEHPCGARRSRDRRWRREISYLVADFPPAVQTGTSDGGSLHVPECVE